MLFDNQAMLNEQFAGRKTTVYKNFAGEFLLVLDGAEIHAFKNRCPHQNKPLNDCELSEGHVVCPYHRYAFSCTDGKGQGLYLEKHEIRYEGQKIFIGIEKWSLF